MISQSRFMGGSTRTALTGGTLTLFMGSDRVQLVRSTVGNSTVQLPTAFLDRFTLGITWFTIIREPGSTRDISILNELGGLIATLDNTNTAAKIHLSTFLGTRTWRAHLRQVNVAGALNHSTRGSIVNPVPVETFNSDCFDGDPCDRIDGLSSGIAMPMFEDIIDKATNTYREPVRAGDRHLPRQIPIRLTADTFQFDPLHTASIGELSTEFYKAVFGDTSKQHLLNYVGQYGTTSRHWLHARYAGNYSAGFGTWRLHDTTPTTALTMNRHLWRKNVTYTIAATGVQHTAELQFVVEHSVGTSGASQPILIATDPITYTAATLSWLASDFSINDSNGGFVTKGFKANHIVAVSGFTGGGPVANNLRIVSVTPSKMVMAPAWGQSLTFTDDAAGESVSVQTVTGGTVNNATMGAYGGIGVLYVFTDEVNFGVSDPQSYTPTGASGAISFNRTDPCIWGYAVAAQGGTIAKKFCHPQLAIAANLVTNFQAPVGKNKVTLGDELNDWCYLVPNGAPWTTTPNTQHGSVAMENGIRGNVVFGSRVEGFAWASMTLGGGFPTSEMMEFVCIENGRAVGRTLLKPTNPGYNEATGELDVESGSDIEISLCDVGQREFDPCDGHPDEKFETTGGSHGCFRNRAASPYCCIITNMDATAQATAKCKRTTTPYDSGCNPLANLCAITATWVTSFVLNQNDYDMRGGGGNQLLREITWRAFVIDPTSTLYSLTYAGSSTSWNVDTAVGTCSHNVGPPAYVACTGVTGGVTPNFVAAYQPSAGGYEHVDGQIDATVTNIPSNGIVGVGWSGQEITTTNEINGYYIVANTQTGAVTLKRSDGSTKVVLGSGNDPALIGATSVVVSFIRSGSSIIARAGVASLEADDCKWQTGHPILVQESATTGARWTSLVITDRTLHRIEALAGLYAASVSLIVDVKAVGSYGHCADSYSSKPNCGTSPECSCYVWSESLVQDVSDGVTEPISTAPYSTPDGADPYDCTGPGCESGAPKCGDCPTSFKFLVLRLPSQCGHDGISPDPTKATICGGFALWYNASIACF